MMIDKDLLEVMRLAGLNDEQITEPILPLADHMFKVNPRIASAAAALRQDLKRKGVLK
jgi:hypothetical protein